MSPGLTAEEAHLRSDPEALQGKGQLSAREISGLTQEMGSGLSLSYLTDDKAKLDRNKRNRSLSLQDKTQGISSPQWLILFF